MSAGALDGAPHSLALPVRKPGPRSAATQAAVEAWCAALQDTADGLGFKVGSRGWCYVLEEYGLAKGDFGKAQDLITDCRKRGLLPIDFCAEDSAREFFGLEELHDTTPEEMAAAVLAYVERAHSYYTPLSFWEAQDVYIAEADGVNWSPDNLEIVRFGLSYEFILSQRLIPPSL